MTEFSKQKTTQFWKRKGKKSKMRGMILIGIVSIVVLNPFFLTPYISDHLQQARPGSSLKAPEPFRQHLYHLYALRQYRSWSLTKELSHPHSSEIQANTAAPSLLCRVFRIILSDFFLQ